MEVILEDEDLGVLVRAARCDGTHDTPTLASRRLFVNDVTFDCCPHHLAEVVRMAIVCGAPFRIEPTVDDSAVALLRECPHGG